MFSSIDVQLLNPAIPVVVICEIPQVAKKTPDASNDILPKQTPSEHAVSDQDINYALCIADLEFK